MGAEEAAMSIWGRRVDAWFDQAMSTRGGRTRRVAIAFAAALLAGGAVIGLVTEYGRDLDGAGVLYLAIGGGVLVGVAVWSLLAALERRQ
jgi:hypothetical protein